MNPNAGGSTVDSIKTDAVGGGGGTPGVGNIPSDTNAGLRPKPDALTAEPETQSTGELPLCTLRIKIQRVQQSQV